MAHPKASFSMLLEPCGATDTCGDCEPSSFPWLASPAPPSPPSSSEVPIWFPDFLGFLAHSMLFPSLCLGLGYLIHMVWPPTPCPTSFLFFQWTPSIFKCLLGLHLHQEVFSTLPYWAVLLGISQKPLQNWTIGCRYKLPSESLQLESVKIVLNLAGVNEGGEGMEVPGLGGPGGNCSSSEMGSKPEMSRKATGGLLVQGMLQAWGDAGG